MGIPAAPEVNHFPYICFLFEFPPGPLWVYGFGICIPFPAGNWVSLVLLVAFFLVYFCSFFSSYHPVKDGSEFFCFFMKKKSRENCYVVLFLLKSVFACMQAQMWVRSCLLKLTLCAVVLCAGEKVGVDAR